MLSRLTHLWVARVALLAMLLTALLPTLSMAMPQSSGRQMVQEICSSQGNKLLIQVMTTQGQWRATLIDYQPAKKPVSLGQHLAHCPFCHGVSDAPVLPVSNPAYVLYQQAQQRVVWQDDASPAVSTVFFAAHPTRAPPSAH